MRRLLIAGAALALCGSVATPRPVSAQSAAPLRFIIAGQVCFRIRVGYKHLSPQERMNRINGRVPTIIGRETLRPSNINLVRRGEYTDIYIGRTPLVTVTPGDAKANGHKRTHTLAAVWLAKLREAVPQARPQMNQFVKTNRPPSK